MLQTRSQRLARDVFDRVSTVKNDPSADPKKYGALAHRLPVLIRSAGLAQALAFVEASSERMSARLLADLNQTVNGGQNLASTCRSASLSQYMRLTRDSLDALLWYKRYAQSVLNIKSGADESPVEQRDEAEAGGQR